MTALNVQRGARFLDERDPDWYRKIDLDTLNLGSSCACVLGQLHLFKHPRTEKKWVAYSRELLEINGEVEEKPWLFGFITDGDHGQFFSNLTADWKTEIRRRLKAAQA